MHVGRNDPCPCGSGKKYKKCCLASDRSKMFLESNTQDAAAVEPQAPVVRSSPAARPPAPRVEKPPDPFDALWKEFAASDLEAQIAQFQKMLEEPAGLDDELAFAMLSTINAGCRKAGQRGRHNDLVALLRHKAPDAYQSHAAYYLWLVVPSALAAGTLQDYPFLSQDLADAAVNNLDAFLPIQDQLEYHGLLTPLLESVRLAWGKVKDSDDILPWGIEEFAATAIDYEIFAYLQETEHPDPHDPALIARCKHYVQEFDADYFRHDLLHLTGRASRTWSLPDFILTPKKSKKKSETDADKAPRNCQMLLREFVGEIRRQQGIPCTRGKLAIVSLYQYLIRRQAGDGKSSGKQRIGSTTGLHPLCPDAKTLDRHLGELLQFMSDRHFQVAATMEVIPLWLGFLQSRGLLTEAERLEALEKLKGLHAQVLRLCAGFDDDPTPVANLRSAWAPFLPILQAEQVD